MTNKLAALFFLICRLVFLRVRFFRLIVFILFFTGPVFSVWAQDEPVKRRGSRIIDDTTKQIYGPNTSRYYYEDDVFFNKEVSNPIDTAILNYHRFNFIQRNNNLYHDLGNIGTAANPIFYKTPDVIGVSSGFQSFDLYWDREKIKYYDTKSPYTDLKIVLGGRGRSMTDVSFSRNINPRWNFGFDYNAMLIDKQIQRRGKGDRNVRSTYYDIYTAYQTKDSTYRLFVNFKRHKYIGYQNGGIRADSAAALETYFYNNAQPWLSAAESRERRTNIHLYQQYKILGKVFQLYHTLDAYRQHNYFYDRNSLEPVDYYDFNNEEVAKDTVRDATRFISMRNEAGLKGNLAKLFYNGYYAMRQFDMNYRHLTDAVVRVPTHGTEHYVGGRMALLLDSIGDVKSWAEIEPVSGNFRIDGSIKSKWFEASVKQMQYAPGFLLQAYQGSHDIWNNNFNQIKVTQLNGYVHYKSRVISMSPGMTFTRLNDYVYFKQDSFGSDEPQRVLPAQSNGTQVVASPELRLTITMLKHINFTSQVIYSNILKNDDSALEIPEIFVNTQLSYSNIFFHGNMDMHGGVDVHWKSDYYAMGFDPAIQQFYRQNYFQVPAFPIIDLFYSAKIKRGRVFFKYNNLVQAFTKNGYFSTPYYPGQRNVIDFGFDLFFYD